MRVRINSMSDLMSDLMSLLASLDTAAKAPPPATAEEVDKTRELESKLREVIASPVSDDLAMAALCVVLMEVARDRLKIPPRALLFMLESMIALCTEPGRQS